MLVLGFEHVELVQQLSTMRNSEIACSSTPLRAREVGIRKVKYMSIDHGLNLGDRVLLHLLMCTFGGQLNVVVDELGRER